MDVNNAGQLIIGHREALCAANLEFFRTQLQTIYKRLIEHSPTLSLTLDQNQQLMVATAHLPPTPEVTFRWWQKPLYEAFRNPATRSQFIAEARIPRLNEDGTYTDPVDPDYFHSPIDPAFRERFARFYEAHYPRDHILSDRFIFGDNGFPILTMLGVANGWLLNRLIEDYEIRHLIIIEPDLDMMLLSLYLLDWRDLVQKVRETGRFLSIILEADPSVAGLQAVLEIKDKWPMFFASGLNFVTASPFTNSAEKIQDAMRDHFKLLLQGWGFFDDEILSLKHATENLRNNWPVQKKTGVLDGTVPVVVVGSGPSLDGQLEILSKIRDHVIIICCGTAISALEKADIKPDFLVEIERTRVTPDLLKLNANTSFTRSIPIIFPVSMHPDLPTLTDTPLVIGKLADTATRLYSTPETFNITINTNPTVTNCGLDLAVIMGGREIYLFGVDLGFINRDRHHSSMSAYHDESAADTLQMKMKLDSNKMAAEAFEVPGNFRESVFTQEVMNIARTEMSFFIRHRYQDARVFNCNDGALIDGANPMLPDSIPVNSMLSGPLKHDSVSAILSSFSPPDLADEVAERLAYLREDMDKLCSGLKTLLNKPIATRQAFWDRLGEMYLQFDPFRETSPAASLLHGSILHILCASYETVARDPDDSHALEFARFACDHLTHFLDEARNVLEKEVFCGHLN